ncbi:hypothetical protein PG997_001349 [Apiospora hydei]|uniref:Clr5 domain-containing protein n=1 Tax=Apiospora hydei TaxID=1337664 RepID=A0ABR1XDF2_9PEZI
MSAPTTQIRWARPRVDWTDEVRELITELYQRQNRPLKEVVRIMQVEHGFSATETMYKKRIKQWGLWKNLRHSDTTTTTSRDQVAIVEADSGRRDVVIRARNPHDTRVRGHSTDRRKIQASKAVEISHFAQPRHGPASSADRRPTSWAEPTTLKAPDDTGAWKIEEEGLRDEEWRFDGAGSQTQVGNWAGLAEAGIQLLDQHRTKEAFRVFDVLFNKYRLLLRDKRLFANLFPLTLTVIVNLTRHHPELGRSLARHIHQLCTIIKPSHFPLHDRLMKQLCLMDSEATCLAARRLSDFYMDELESYSGLSQPMITNMGSMAPNLAVHDLRNSQIFIDRAEYLLARLKSRGEEHSYAARYVKGIFAWLHFHTGEVERAWKMTAEVLSQPFTAEETEAARDGDHIRLEAASFHLRIYIATKRGDREECLRLIPLAARHFIDNFGWASVLTVQSHALLVSRLEEIDGGELMAQQMRDEMQAGIEAYCRAEMRENGL